MMPLVFEHSVDELAQRIINENPPTSMSAAYREVARRLYETINPIGRKAPATPVATLRAIVTLCENALPGNERVVLDNIRDVAEAAMKGRK